MVYNPTPQRYPEDDGFHLVSSRCLSVSLAQTSGSFVADQNLHLDFSKAVVFFFLELGDRKILTRRSDMIKRTE